jgi:prevent-host-death family protein
MVIYPTSDRLLDKTAVLAHLFIMITMSSSDARLRFGEFLDKGSREPILIKRQSREIGVFIPMKDFHKLQELRRSELRDAVNALSKEGRANGFTEKLLNKILSEVNPS